MNASILAILAEYGTPAIFAVIILYIIWLVLTNFASAKFKSFFSSEKKQENEKKSRKEDLKYHSFFANAKYRLIAEIPALEILPEKPVKEKMFRDLISIEVRLIYETCESIIESDLESWSAEQWKNEVYNKINSMISGVFNKAREEGIPEIAITKYNKWHATSLEILYEYITTLSTSLTYEDNITRTNTLLIIMNLLLVSIIADAERSLKDLNGEISGKLYKNMVLED